MVLIIILLRMSFTKGLVGLAISYALSVTDRLSGMLTSFTETEKQIIVSVERAVQYIEDVQPEISPRGTVSINNISGLCLHPATSYSLKPGPNKR